MSSLCGWFPFVKRLSTSLLGRDRKEKFSRLVITLMRCSWELVRSFFVKKKDIIEDKILCMHDDAAPCCCRPLVLVSAQSSLHRLTLVECTIFVKETFDLAKIIIVCGLVPAKEKTTRITVSSTGLHCCLIVRTCIQVISVQQELVGRVEETVHFTNHKAGSVRAVTAAGRPPARTIRLNK